MERRTPPGVRELKLAMSIVVWVLGGRTPPGVRELKLCISLHKLHFKRVAPLPGCGN